MRQTCYRKCRCAFPWIYPLILIATMMSGALVSGCFVLTGDRRNKPQAPRDLVKLNTKSDIKYWRLLDSPDLNLEIGVENGPIRWEAPFLFYILPLPTSYDYLATQPMRVEVHVEPKSLQVTLDPWQIFLLGTNQVRVPPAHIWQDQNWLGTNTTKALPITNSATFLLEFTPWDRVYPDRDLPFQLSIQGIRVSGQCISLLPITFKPTKFIRSGFQLPY